MVSEQVNNPTHILIKERIIAPATERRLHDLTKKMKTAAGELPIYKISLAGEGSVRCNGKNLPQVHLLSPTQSNI